MKMPFGEVMYRCNAHYCLSSVFRNRVVGLVITLALMQLFLFSFYLNGLHSQTAVVNSPVSEQQDSLLVAAGQQQQQQTLRHGLMQVAPPDRAIVRDIELDRRSVGQPVLNPSISKAKDAAKKALDHLMTNKKPAMDLMAMAAKKLSSDNDPMAKLGLNLLANALNNVKAPSTAVVDQRDQTAAGPVRSTDVDEDQQSNSARVQQQQQYANLAQMGLQMLTNGLASKQGGGGSDSTNNVLDMATQLMIQSAKLSSKAGLDPQVAKTALGFLRGAVASQKLDPKMMLGLASKMMQMQSAVDSTGSGINLLSQLLASNGAAAGLLASAAKPVTAEQSRIISRNYVKIASKKLPGIKSKMAKPYTTSSKVVVDIGFQYSMENVDACRTNATYLIVAVSSAANMDERQAARDTWLKDLHQLAGDTPVDIIFMIGQTANVSLQRLVDKEAAQYRDLVQTNVQEPVENAVFKTLSALAWVERHCADIQQILKMDDDVYVSPARMLKALRDGRATPTITGSLIDNMNPHTTSDKRHKTTKKAWPLKEFPRFVLGGAYLMGRPAVPRLLAAAQITPILPLEDVYVTGLCATGGQVELIPNKSLFEEEISEELETCTFEDFASWRSTGPADVRQTWNFAQAMKRSGEVCVRPATKCFMGICIPASSTL